MNVVVFRWDVTVRLANRPWAPWTIQFLIAFQSKDSLFKICTYLILISVPGNTRFPLHFEFPSLPFPLLHITSLYITSLHFTSFHFTSLPFTSHHFPLLHFPSLHITSLYFTSLHFTPLPFTSLITFLTLFLKVHGLEGIVPKTFIGSLFQSWMLLFTKEYFPISLLCLLFLISQS